MIRAHPPATLITAGTGSLLANLVPFTPVDDGENGTLLAHVANANDQVSTLSSGTVVSQGPEAHFAPSWYVSKQEHGRVVPTWNYAVVQVSGTPRVIDDSEWLRAQIEHLTSSPEDKRFPPCSVTDAPEPYISGQMKVIIGIEIPSPRSSASGRLARTNQSLTVTASKEAWERRALVRTWPGWWQNEELVRSKTSR